MPPIIVKSLWFSSASSFYMIGAKPEKLIGDKVDDLDLFLAKEGIDLAPYRSNRRDDRKTQDIRKLRRYRRRWIVGRFFAWIQYKRRLLVRWEFHPANSLGFGQLASIGILLTDFEIASGGWSHGGTKALSVNSSILMVRRLRSVL